MLNQQDSGMADGKRGASRGKDPCKVSQRHQEDLLEGTGAKRKWPE